MTLPATKNTYPVSEHHDEPAERMTSLESVFQDAVRSGADASVPRQAFDDFAAGGILNHKTSEERMRHSAAHEMGLTHLVDAMEMDHADQLALIGKLREVDSDLSAALTAHTLRRVVAGRAPKEDKVLVPAMVEAGVDVHALLSGNHDIVED